MGAVTVLMALFSVLVPSKMWYSPTQPIKVDNKSNQAITLMLTTFAGQRVEAKGSTEVGANASADVSALFPGLQLPGTYVLFAVPTSGGPGSGPGDFVGTPLVIRVADDKRPGAPPGPVVVHVEPLEFVHMDTDQGPMTMIFYYDVAPNTSDSFLKLAREGFFDGLTFHRIIPGFVLQGGDPRGDGTGGPGYNVDAEFNDRKHEPGVLSMARNGDPDEAQGVMPRSEFANSAGSQFFICLDYTNTKHLDRRYTACGKVVEGLDTMTKLAALPIADPSAGRPVTPPVIKKAEVRPVTPKENPYGSLISIGGPTSQPSK